MMTLRLKGRVVRLKATRVNQDVVSELLKTVHMYSFKY